MRRMAIRHFGLAAVLLLLLGGRAYSQTTTTAAPTTTTTAAPTTTTTATTTTSTTTTTTLPTVSWQVIIPTDCTKSGAPNECCVSGTSGANERCNLRMNFAHLFEVYATFEPVNNGTYTAGGNVLAPNQFKKLGLSTIVATLCNPTMSGRQVLITQPNPLTLPPVLTIHLFNSGGTETPNGTALVNSQGMGLTDNFTCLILGR